MRFDLVVVADLCVDILFVGDVVPEYGQVEQFVDDYQIDLGGSAAIFSSQFVKLGGNPALFGIVGNDPFGDILAQRIKALGLSTEYIIKDARFKTAVGLGLAKGADRAMLTYKGTMDAITPERVLASEVLKQSKHIHISSFYLLEHLHDMWGKELAALKTQGYTISLDTNWSPHGNWTAVNDLLPLVDVFIPNDEEAMRISGKSDCDEAGQWLNQHCGLVVIKRGKHGATVYQNGSSSQYTIPEHLSENLRIADTTGAGDNFAAGFVYAWLNDKPMDECVSLAIQCGTSSLSKIGGIEGQFLPELEIK